MHIFIARKAPTTDHIAHAHAHAGCTCTCTCTCAHAHDGCMCIVVHMRMSCAYMHIHAHAHAMSCVHTGLQSESARDVCAVGVWGCAQPSPICGRRGGWQAAGYELRRVFLSHAILHSSNIRYGAFARMVKAIRYNSLGPRRRPGGVLRQSDFGKAARRRRTFR
jgi:hypothetical protein